MRSLSTLVISLLAVCSCSQSESEASHASAARRWSDNAEQLARLGLGVSLSRDGPNVAVSVTNNSEKAVCIGRSGWPTQTLGLDHFKVSDGETIVAYSGPLNSVINDPVLKLKPHQTWTLRTHLEEAYRTDWRTARVEAFWAPFSDCGVGEVPAS